METELLLLFAFQSVGLALFGKFQTETAWWRQVLKWAIILLMVYSLHLWIGTAVTIITLTVLMITGTVLHIIWCNRNGIHPLHATPRKKYYTLRGWDWKE